jgi:AraC-like DNA-binding protein
MAKKSKNPVPSEPNPNGRPPIEIDMEQLGALCRMKPTLYDCAAFFKCSIATIERRIKENTGLTFAEFRDQNLVHTKYDLIQKAINKADHSEAMHKFCLKNLADWREKTDMTSDGKAVAPPAQVIINLPANGREGKK